MQQDEQVERLASAMDALREIRCGDKERLAASLRNTATADNGRAHMTLASAIDERRRREISGRHALFVLRAGDAINRVAEAFDELARIKGEVIDVAPDVEAAFAASLPVGWIWATVRDLAATIDAAWVGELDRADAEAEAARS